MTDLWQDILSETAIDAVSITAEAQVRDLIGVMEEIMPWYDHVACAFLLYSDARLAAEKIEHLIQVKHQPKENWKSAILTQLVSVEATNKNYESLWLQLVETLHILNYNKLIEMRSLSYPMSAGSIDSFRLELFSMIDDMSKENAAELALELNSKLPNQIKSHNDWPIELYLLKWIHLNDITQHNWNDVKSKLNENWKFPSQPNVESFSAEPQGSATSGKLKTLEKLPELRKFTVQSGLCVIVNQMNFFMDYQLPGELLRVNLNFNICYSFLLTPLTCFSVQNLACSSDMVRIQIVIVCQKYSKCLVSKSKRMKTCPT